jgi:hypothetical protein
MADESKRIEEDWKNTPARKPSKKKELIEKAKKYIMEQAEEANDGPLKEEK